ncbi:MAG: 2-amino-4-hydroxy-6-hydroxymethyldihydropteridine diphosphokinase [Porticoccus sp.]|jgi:2-amino-4-hydroxy-6-hydroxymethyldihydropteridine diphosphokinase
MTVVAYISVGSNLNNPYQQVKSAIGKLKIADNIYIETISGWYLSDPVGPKNQSRYVNGVIKISTRLSPNQLLKKLHEIEDAHGRIRNVRWGPRTLDLDILLYGSRMMNTKKLTIPHPEMKIRNFVLTPLADIEPDLVLPDGSILSSLLENNQLKDVVPILPGDVIEKIG